MFEKSFVTQKALKLFYRKYLKTPVNRRSLEIYFALFNAASRVGNAGETITDPQGQVTTYLYDNAKRLTGKNLSNGEKLRYTLDNAGRTIQTQTFDAQNNLATTESATYDGLNRITQRINAQNKITACTYDANGNVTAVTDPNNLTTTTQYDALNRPILITDPLGKTVATTYDPKVVPLRDNTQNLITSVRDPNANTTTYTYSGFGDNLQTQSPDTGLTTATYNAGSLPVTKTDARGKTSSYT